MPDQLADEAQRAGLLSPEAIERLVREAIRQRALGELKGALDRMAAVDEPEMTPEEITVEIKAARAERGRPVRLVLDTNRLSPACSGTTHLSG